MRPIACVSVIAAVAWLTSGTPGQPPEPRPDPIAEAEGVCISLLRSSENSQQFTKHNISERSIRADFAEIRQLLDRDYKSIQVTAMKAVEKSKDPFKDPHKESIKESDATRDIVVAVWVEWRVPRPTGQLPRNLVAVLDSLEDFSRVRFKSEPAKAAVLIDGVNRGQTPYQVFLNRNGKFSLKMTKEGYETWEKKEFTPSNRGDIFDEKLKKMP